MNVSALAPGEHAAYRAFVSDHPVASVYHTLAWQRVVQTACGDYGYRPIYLVARQQGRITGALPLFETKGLLRGRYFLALPLSHHVPALAEDAHSLRALAEHALQLAHQRQARFVEVRGSADALSACGFRVLTPYLVTRLDLKPGETALRRGVAGAARRNVKKARRRNVTVQRGASAADWRAFARLSLETRRHQGTTPFPPRLFDALQEMPQARLYLARRDAHVLAGIVVLVHRRQAIYACGASAKDAAALQARPNDLLFWDVIAGLAREGCHTLDLGTTPHDNPNLLRFKEKWGACSEPLGYAHWSPTARHVTPPRRHCTLARLARATLRRTPLTLYARLGGLRERL